MREFALEPQATVARSRVLVCKMPIFKLPRAEDAPAPLGTIATGSPGLARAHATNDAGAIALQNGDRAAGITLVRIGSARNRGYRF
jgi:hypothetical protein